MISLPLLSAKEAKVAPETISDEDFMMSMLEFTPNDYMVMAKSLSEQVWGGPSSSTR